MRQSLHQTITRRLGTFRLRTVLVVPFVFQICGAIGVIGILSYRNEQQTVTDLASQIIREVSDRTQQHLQSYTALPPQLTQLVADDVRLGKIDLASANFQPLDVYVLKHLRTFDAVSFIAIANERGKFIGAGSNKGMGKASYFIEVADATTQGTALTYPVDDQGRRIQQATISRPDPRYRSWYAAIAQDKKTIWSDISFLGDVNQGLAITAISPFPAAPGNPLGIVAATLHLNDVNRFLKNLSISKSGQVFILEPNGFLVASSGDPDVYTENRGTAERLMADRSRNPLIRATAEQLQTTFGTFGALRDRQQLEFDFQQQRQFVQVTPWQDGYGLKWLIVAVVPKSEFTEHLRNNTRMTILMCFAAFGGTVAISLFVSRWVVSPISKLNLAAKEIAKGEWQKIIATDRQDEIGELAKSFNEMATQLQLSFADLQQLNGELSESQSRLTQFLEALPIGVAVHYPNGEVVYLNQSAISLLGVEENSKNSAEHLTGGYQVYRSGTSQLYPVEELPAMRALRGKCVLVDDLEVHREGEVLPCEARAIPILNGNGEVAYAIVVFQNISDRRRTEAERRQTEIWLKAHARQQAAVAQFGQNALANTDLQGLMDRAVTLIAQLLDVHYAKILEFLPEQNSLLLRAGIGWRPDSIGREMIACDRQCQEGFTLLSAEPVLVADLDAESRFAKPLTPYSDDVVSGMSVVIPGFHQPFGVLSIHTTCPRTFSKDELHFMEAIASILATAIERKQKEAEYSQMLECQVKERTLALEHEIGDRKKAEMALRQVNLELEQANSELERLATLDGLTQVANRRRFDICLAQEWKRAIREQQPLALVMCDVDFFKLYNDRYGHQRGDHCLRQVAVAMQRTVKRPADLLARYGGEEFAIILPNTALEGAYSVAKEIQDAVKQLRLEHEMSSVSRYITLSLGVASIIPSHRSRSDLLVAAADAALYEAKHQGRDRAVIHLL